MAGWPEIERIRKDAAAFCGLARRLLARGDEDFSDWEAAFLESVAAKKGAQTFTSRQGEKLLEIRDNCELVTTWRGFSVRTLLAKCHAARADLSEDDEEWIVATRTLNPDAIKRRSLSRLLRLSGQLHLIDPQ